MKITALLIAFTVSLIAFGAYTSQVQAQETFVEKTLEENLANNPEFANHPALTHYFEISGFMKDGEVHVTVDGESAIQSERFSERPEAEQKAFLEHLNFKMAWCGKKGLVAVKLAVQAGLKIDTAEDQIAILEKIAAQKGIRMTRLMGSMRTINEAYRRGWKDPVKFAQQTIKNCLIEGE